MKYLYLLGIPSLALASVLSAATASAQYGASIPSQVVPPQGPVPADYFGMHIHKAARPRDANASFVTTPWPQIPFKTWRLWDTQTTWRQLEPNKGEWHFELLDQYVALAQQHNVSILMTLGQTPAWASARPTEKTYFPGTAAEPTSLADWDDYVRKVATRYKGRIHAYELWNEPNEANFFSGTIPMMAQMSQRAVAIIRQVDPAALIVSPGISRDAQYLDQYIKAGGAKGVDVIGFHFYVHGQPEDLLSSVAQVKGVLANNGLSNLQIWNTESGWGDWKDGVNTFTPETAAGFVARANILFWVSGVSHFYWYAWDNHWWVKLAMTQNDSTTETPAAQAYRTVNHWMVGSRFQTCQQSPGKIWICPISRDNHRAWIVWAPAGHTRYTAPPAWALTSMESLTGQAVPLTSQTIDVGPAPILLY